VDREHVAIPSLLAVGAVQHHLVREGIRMMTGLVIETAEAREVHHFALLLGYGAAAVNPYLALDTVDALVEAGELEGVGAGDLAAAQAAARGRYVEAVGQGLLKVMSKMGISTMESYTGAQLFEAVGLDAAVIDRCFAGTASRLAGVDFAVLGEELLRRHARGFGDSLELLDDELPVGGVYRWRRRGERHGWNPATIAELQRAVRSGDAAAYERFAALCDAEADGPITLRSQWSIEPLGPAVPLDEVEPVAAILARFSTGAMSFGSISAPAHETLARAMNGLGARSNSGEGGEERERYAAADDLRRSRIKQIASGRFGVHVDYLVHADDLQIKIAQGAKPGEGGQLPGSKVTERIAAVRCATPGVSLISPPPHHDIYSIEDLAQLIADLKTVNERARVSVKLVAEVGVGTVAAGVAKAGAECVVIAGHAGGTGASPVSSVRHCGLPWEMGLAEAQQVLVRNGLRGHVRLQVDGGLRTARDVLIGALLGAEEFGFSTAPLVALGCVMLRKCHLGSCSVGIATQDELLIEAFTGEPLHVERYFTFVAEAVRRELARLGARSLDELVGRADRLRMRGDRDGGRGHWKAARLDLSALMTPAVAPAGAATRFERARPPELATHLDRTLIERCAGALTPDPGQARAVALRLPIRNVDRTVGAMLSAHAVRLRGPQGLPDDLITVNFTGSAGQSFGAFLCGGLTFVLEGDANDYVGKGLSGGRLAVLPPAESRFVAADNVIIGNVALYGATAGELYAAGQAGERFAVRNSGARAVVEGVGDHACEYMTGGVVVVLGSVGRNFAAGMSGGMAFVHDEAGELRKRCNRELVDLERVVDPSDIWLLRRMLEDHVRFTSSVLGQRLLDHFELVLPRFVKVMPREYKAILLKRRAAGTRTAAAPRLEVLGG
jgi:glutamate synthase (NADPH/NADH) large chain